MRTDSRAQSRPYVYVQVVPSLAHGEDVWDVFLENGGRSVARNVTVRLGHPWPSRGDSDQVTAGIRALFETPQTLAPGQRLRTYWYMPADPKADPAHEQGVRDAVATVSYYGQETSRKPFVEEYQLRTTNIGLTPVPADGFNPPDKWAESDRSKFYSVLQTIARHVGELRR
ncbi:hypothetical protein I8D64_11675 [Brachybacterium sp. MASK1Z-5]|uniref:Uncharacterized protein n=1 Tax=Brachybacterium halotolerans TaxID=2795215 RepID=A0ABS1BBQ2_9MICO|nr:hypothetical protein [Brachybacterium halotolerans]MBK0332058.1 hypothetical protein [Brachybacterium halotolerans]